MISFRWVKCSENDVKNVDLLFGGIEIEYLVKSASQWVDVTYAGLLHRWGGGDGGGGPQWANLINGYR